MNDENTYPATLYITNGVMRQIDNGKNSHMQISFKCGFLSAFRATKKSLISVDISIESLGYSGTLLMGDTHVFWRSHQPEEIKKKFESLFNIIRQQPHAKVDAEVLSRSGHETTSQTKDAVNQKSRNRPEQSNRTASKTRKGRQLNNHNNGINYAKELATMFNAHGNGDRSTPLFDEYIMADYSGAKAPTSQKIKICWYHAREGDEPVHCRNNLTREELRQHLIHCLQRATKDRKRVLVGLDHQFGWPSILLKILGMQDQSWLEFWTAMVSGCNGIPALDHPSVFASVFNHYLQDRKLCHSGPYYSLNPSNSYGLPAQQDLIALRQDEYRHCENLLRQSGGNPKSAFMLLSNGDVGGQTICGMIELLKLIKEADDKNIPVAVWPFDGLNLDNEAYKGRHTFVELYPTYYYDHLNMPELKRNRTDEADAYISMKFALQADRIDGTLAKYFDLSSHIELEEQIRSEGWIFGLMARSRDSEQETSMGRDLPTFKPRDDRNEANAANISTTHEQDAIVHCRTPLLRVIARAGTGKTFTMTQMTRRIVADDPKARVLLLTFTRNAADEMRNRLLACGVDPDRFTATTFHAFGLRALLKSGRNLPLGDNLFLNMNQVTLVNEMARDQIFDFIRMRYPKLGLEVAWGNELSKCLNQVDSIHGSLTTILDTVKSNVVPNINLPWRKLLEIYCREWIMDFDMIMLLFLQRIQDKGFRTFARGELTHVIVDEFQDTNAAQLESLRWLAGYADEQDTKLDQVAVVGDDFQSIYEFRGAVPGVFDRFAEWDASTETLPLCASQRCGERVRQSANDIGHKLAVMPNHAPLCRLVPPDLTAPENRVMPTGEVKNLRGDSSHSLPALVASLHEAGYAYGEISILSYSNPTALNATANLSQAGIPSRQLSSKPEYAEGVSRFADLLLILLTPDHLNFAAWWHVLRMGNSGIQCSEFASLMGKRSENAGEVLELLLEHAGVWKSFLQTYLLKSPVRTQTDADTWSRILDTAASVDARISEQKAACRRFIDIFANASDATEALNLLGQATRKDLLVQHAESDDRVEVSTVHQYKGLENKVVLVLYDWSPDRSADMTRLDYVARTRAAEVLVMLDRSVAQSHDGGGAGVAGAGKTSAGSGTRPGVFTGADILLFLVNLVRKGVPRGLTFGEMAKALGTQNNVKIVLDASKQIHSEIGRQTLTDGTTRIEVNLDAFLWSGGKRPNEMHFKNNPYTLAEWEALFPEGVRDCITASDLTWVMELRKEKSEMGVGEGEGGKPDRGKDADPSQEEWEELLPLREWFYNAMDKESNEPEKTTRPPQDKEVIDSASQSTKEPQELKVIFDELDQLVGLDAVKDRMLRIANTQLFYTLRREAGLPVKEIGRHFVFTGNPGTGKTTVARIFARMLKELGVMEKGHLVEVDRSSLVAKYLGQTESKTKEVIESAFGGILFIDEAYTLAHGREDMYGRQAIEILLKMMEDHKDKLTVIVAGYTEQMNQFLDSNPGLRSRFTHRIDFPDYSPEDLVVIMDRQCEASGYHLAEATKEALLDYFRCVTVAGATTLGNGRLARNVFEHAVENLAQRVTGFDAPTRADLCDLLPEDIRSIEIDAKPSQRKDPPPEPAPESGSEFA